MSKPEWTPGPWDHAGSLVYANRPRDGGTICQVSEVRYSHIVQHKEPALGSPDHEEIYANAHLIAAAPTLYEAAQSAEYRLKSVVEAYPDDGWSMSVLSTLRAALAKARGES